MSTTLVLVIVLVFSFAAGRLLEWVRVRAGVPMLGMYLLVGLGVGPLGLGLLDGERLHLLQPVLSMLLGLLGFVLGLGLRRRISQVRGLEAGVLSGLIAGGMVGGVVFGLAFGLGLDGADPVWLAVTLGAIAAVSDGELLARVGDRLGAAGPVRRLIQALSLAGSTIAVVAFGLALALARAKSGSGTLGLTPVEWLLAALAVGVACGILFRLFIGRWMGDQRTFLATVAILTLASGLASGMDISPLLVGLVTGATVSVFSTEATRLATSMETLEGPAMIAVLVFAGATWSPPAPLGLGLALAALLVRPLALRTAAWVSPRVVGELPRGRRLGDALLPQGGLGVAIAVNSAQVFPETASVVLTAALAGLFVYDLLGPRTVRRVLADAGEVVHRAGAPGASPATEVGP